MSIRVVMAEDHALVRAGTRAILEQSGDIEVVGEAADGEEAVAVVARLSPDLVLMDVSMPGLNGIEATRRIKALHPDTPVLALSAYDDESYLSALLDAGATGYLLKICTGDELVAAVRAALAGASVLSSSLMRKAFVRLVGGDSAASSDGHQASAQTDCPLTEREHEVLELVVGGLTNKAIGAALHLSPRTVQLHLAHIFAKLGVASRTEAVTVGLRQGWLRLERTV